MQAAARVARSGAAPAGSEGAAGVGAAHVAASMEPKINLNFFIYVVNSDVIKL